MRTRKARHRRPGWLFLPPGRRFPSGYRRHITGRGPVIRREPAIRRLGSRIGLWRTPAKITERVRGCAGFRQRFPLGN